jgi:hypothetical protein
MVLWYYGTKGIQELSNTSAHCFLTPVVWCIPLWKMINFVFSTTVLCMTVDNVGRGAAGSVGTTLHYFCISPEKVQIAWGPGIIMETHSSQFIECRKN